LESGNGVRRAARGGGGKGRENDLLNTLGSQGGGTESATMFVQKALGARLSKSRQLQSENQEVGTGFAHLLRRAKGESRAKWSSVLIISVGWSCWVNGPKKKQLFNQRRTPTEWGGRSLCQRQNWGTSCGVGTEVSPTEKKFALDCPGDLGAELGGGME